MDAWEIALNKINDLLRDKKLTTSVPSKEGMRFFECDKGQFALEVPRRTRSVKGAKLWFSFPPKVPNGIEVEVKAPGEGRNNKLNTTPGSRMGEGVECWSILITNAQDKPNEKLNAILSGLAGSVDQRVSEAEAICGILSSSEPSAIDGTPQSANDPTIGDRDRNDLEDGNNDAESDSSESQGYEQDPEMRSAVELYAESVATRHYVSQGFQVKKFGKPFDLLCEKDGDSIHVEVKGSRTKLDTVILTINEVTDAENADWQSDLFIVDQIVVERIGEELVAGGGVARVIQKWIPAKEMLSPSRFRYRLPDESQWKFLK